MKCKMIELATQHIENYEFGFVVGRDFYNTSLIEKDMDYERTQSTPRKMENKLSYLNTRLIKIKMSISNLIKTLWAS